MQLFDSGDSFNLFALKSIICFLFIIVEWHTLNSNRPSSHYGRSSWSIFVSSSLCFVICSFVFSSVLFNRDFAKYFRGSLKCGMILRNRFRFFCFCFVFMTRYSWVRPIEDDRANYIKRLIKFTNSGSSFQLNQKPKSEPVHYYLAFAISSHSYSIHNWIFFFSLME